MSRPALDWNVPDMASQLHLSTGYLHLLYRRQFGVSCMDDVIAMHKGQENTPQAQQAIAEAQQLLNRQLAVEQQATNAVMERELRAAVSEWLKANKNKTKMILSKQLTLGSTGDIEFTASVMKEMNKRKPTFPALPKVTINRPAPAPASGEKK